MLREMFAFEEVEERQETCQLIVFFNVLIAFGCP